MLNVFLHTGWVLSWLLVVPPALYFCSINNPVAIPGGSPLPKGGMLRVWGLGPTLQGSGTWDIPRETRLLLLEFAFSSSLGGESTSLGKAGAGSWRLF